MTSFSTTPERCRICSSNSTLLFTAKVLRKYEVSYFQCTSCGFIQTERPYWLKEAYESPINFSDTGIIRRNLRMARICTSLIFLLFDRREKMLDYAGGTGLFTRLMRDIGFDFYWTDPYTVNFLARGFESNSNTRYRVVTSFESFEHFENPLSELEKILALGDNVIVTTELVPNPTPKLENWWYYAPEHGQHIAFYTRASFEVLANQAGVFYLNIDNVHLLLKKRPGLLVRALLAAPFAKYWLFAVSFVLELFIRTKIFDDQQKLR